MIELAPTSHSVHEAESHEVTKTDCEQDRRTSPQSPEDREEDGTNYPAGLKLFMIGVGLMLAVICSNLDRSILGVAIPQITSEFHSLPDIGWYGSAYLLTSCCSQLPFGKLYAGFNIKWVFMTSLTIFEVGSILCAVAPSSSCLIVGRAVAELGATGISTGALLIIAHSMPISQRPMYTAVIGSGIGVTLVFAPFLGGVFTSKLTWRWCFWINLPLGALTLLTTLSLVQLPKRPKRQTSTTWRQSIKRFDIRGNLLLLPSLITLTLALQWGGTSHPWNSWRIVLLLCMFAISGVAWCFVQYLEGDNATIPMRLLKKRSILAAMWFAFSLFGMLFVQSYYIPLWFQAARGDTAYGAGISMLAYTIAMTTKITGYATFLMLLSSFLSAIAAGLAMNFTTKTSTAYWIATLILSGLGFGLGGQQCMLIPQTVLQGDDIALGTSVVMFAETISGTVFLAVSESLFASRLVKEMQRLIPGFDVGKVVAGDVAGLGEGIDERTVEMIRQAYSGALRPIWIICVVLASLSVFGALGTEWVSVKKTAEERGSKSGKGNEIIGDGVLKEGGKKERLLMG